MRNDAFPYLKHKYVLQIQQVDSASWFFAKYGIPDTDQTVVRFYQEVMELSSSYIYEADKKYLESAFDSIVRTLGFDTDTIRYNDCMNAIILSLPILATNIMIYDLLSYDVHVSCCSLGVVTAEFYS